MTERRQEEAGACDVHSARDPQRRPLVRLFFHLLLSHATPVAVVTLALAVLLTALIRISFVLTTLNDSELVQLRAEGTLHRATWDVDEAMQQGQAGCGVGQPASEVTARIRPKADALALLIVETAPGSMRDVAREYLATASEVLSAGDACEMLLAEGVQARRSELDGRLTSLWVDRLAELHAAVATKDESARSMAVSATWVGVPLAGASFLFAMLLARRMARMIGRPLAALSLVAKRMGRGDFGTPVRVDGPAEIVSLADELERMRAQLQELETLKQSFLASVSHELRTPLSKIREALALLEDGVAGDVDPRQRKVLHIARSACEQEIRMVTMLLDLSRLKTRSPIRMRDGVSIERVIQSAVNDEKAEALSRGVEIDVAVYGEPVTCRVDPVLLERAIANLVRNAVSVSKRGQRVRLSRRVDRDPPGKTGCWVRLVIQDEGPGVPEDIRGRVFDPFVTHPVPSSSKKLGVGLGLALAREVAQAHGGDIELIDPDKPGATFQLWLPAEEPLSDSKKRPEGRPALTTADA